MLSNGGTLKCPTKNTHGDVHVCLFALYQQRQWMWHHAGFVRLNSPVCLLQMTLGLLNYFLVYHPVSCYSGVARIWSEEEHETRKYRGLGYEERLSSSPPTRDQGLPRSPAQNDFSVFNACMIERSSATISYFLQVNFYTELGN